MTYTITDIGLLKMYIYIWAFIVTLLITGLVYLLNNLIQFTYQSKKKKDAGIRRINFVIGLNVNVVAVFFITILIVNNYFRPSVAENNVIVVINALERTINLVTWLSIPLYIVLFLAATLLLRNKYYKNMTILKSNNKILGIKKIKGLRHG